MENADGDPSLLTETIRSSKEFEAAENGPPTTYCCEPKVLAASVASKIANARSKFICPKCTNLGENLVLRSTTKVPILNTPSFRLHYLHWMSMEIIIATVALLAPINLIMHEV